MPQTEKITVTIVPSNDEAPDLMLQDFAIPEGADMVIDQSMVDAIDLDMPKDALHFTVSQMPVHGKVKVLGFLSLFYCVCEHVLLQTILHYMFALTRKYMFAHFHCNYFHFELF